MSNIAIPKAPSKYDIIPIHTSDIQTYKACRRKWDWSSPARHNLRRKVSVFGIYEPFWFGEGIHYALENYYNPLLKRDPVESFKTWFEWQWNGGIVAESDLDRVYDLEPELVPVDWENAGDHDDNLTKYYRVRGLSELLPEPVEEIFEEFRELGIGMMEFYRDYAAREDDFDIIATESTYSVPLGFEAIDTREHSPNYGQKLEVHARGKRDAVIQFHGTGKYGIIDHKTGARIDEDYFIKLEKDPQCMNYMWATQEEAKMHDLPYSHLEWVVYNALHKIKPTPPTPTYGGKKLSIDRQNEGCTAQQFADAIKADPGLTVWFNADLKAQGYYTWLLEMGDKRFVWRENKYYNQHEIAATGEQIKMVAREMLSDPLIYPNPRGTRDCTRCQFRAPCIATDDGSGADFMLAGDYERNLDR